MSEDKIEVNMNVYDIPILVEALEEANIEIERLHSIIKELKEYIEQYDLEGVKLDSEYFYDCLIELTEILDKENK